MMFNARFYKSHLESVSRSFAFCIEELKPDLQSDVALAYLLFRVLDTVEDSTWTANDDQRTAFDLFRKIIAGEAKDESVESEFIQLVSRSSHKPAEQDLVRDTPVLFATLRDLKPSRRDALRAALATMSRGMQYFTLSAQHKIRDLPELNLYCYFVAGCIGELLTDWVFGAADDTLQEMSVHFGLFLQKINILKDMLSDAKEGREFVFAWDEVANSLRAHADAAFEYCQRISPTRADYKIFCAWSLFLGLASFPYIEKSYRQKSAFKISRLEMWGMLEKLKKYILADDRDLLALAFEEKKKNLPALESAARTAFAGSRLLLQKLHPHPSSPRLKLFDFA